jgi:hypothetical protein
MIDGEIAALDEEGRSDFHALKTVIALGGRGAGRPGASAFVLVELAT